MYICAVYVVDNDSAYMTVLGRLLYLHCRWYPILTVLHCRWYPILTVLHCRWYPILTVLLPYTLHLQWTMLTRMPLLCQMWTPLTWASTALGCVSGMHAHVHTYTHTHTHTHTHTQPHSTYMHVLTTALPGMH